MSPILRTTMKILGGMLFLAGLVFFLQGINVIPGSWMTGDPQWAINGGILMLLGVGSFQLSNWRKTT